MKDDWISKNIVCCISTHPASILFHHTEVNYYMHLNLEKCLISVPK